MKIVMRLLAMVTVEDIERLRPVDRERLAQRLRHLAAMADKDFTKS